MQASSNFTKAIHICLYLETHHSDLINSLELAKSVNTNPVVIRRLVSLLKKAGLVNSVSGIKGGFYLDKPADQISLWEIYLAVRDKEFFQRPKVNEECDISCNLELLVKDVFSAAEVSMKSELDDVSIANLSGHLNDILDEQNEK